MLVEVPTNVHTPPNWLAKAMGMSNLDEEYLFPFASTIAIGIKIATTAVLTINADKAATTRHRVKISQRSPLTASFSIPWVTQCIAPVRTKPALITNIAAIVPVA